MIYIEMLIQSLFDMMTDPNARWVLIGCTLLGLSSGVVGSFAYLRRQSLMGDAIAHATLPGVCIAFLIVGTKSLFFFLLGAAIAGLLASYAIGFITRHSKIKQDSALGVVLSVFFGVGIVLLTFIQQSGNGNQSGLDHFLFGHAASMVVTDVWTMVVVSVALVVICTALFKEFKIVSFDVQFTQSLGYPVAVLDHLLMSLIVVTVVIGIQAVGVVLIVALLIIPAVSARYWTDRLHVMVIVSSGFGAISGFVGTYISTLDNNLPTGPLCVLVGAVIFVISLLFAPRRGVVAKQWLRSTLRKKIQQVS